MKSVVLKKILILVAMQSEAKPIIDRLNLNLMSHTSDIDLPFQYFTTVNSEQEIILIVSGTDPRYGVDNIGTQASTLMAYVGIAQFNPDLVISAGTAGGFSERGAKIGTVYLSDREFVFHDRHVPLPGFAEQGIGHYPALNVRALAKLLNLPYGTISSGSSFQKDPGQLEQIKDSGAVAKEMEVAATAWVCWLKAVPLIALKSITNLLDIQESSEKQFVANFALATSQLSEQLFNLLHSLQGKTIIDLAE
jgi:nucleoside phosphorylase